MHYVGGNNRIIPFLAIISVCFSSERKKKIISIKKIVTSAKNLHICKDHGEIMIDIFGVKKSTVTIKGYMLL